MSLRRLVPLPFFFAFCAAAPAEVVTFTGYVTDPGTPSSFQVDGRPLLCDPAHTLQEHWQGGVLLSSTGCPQHSMGESLFLTGTQETHLDPIRARAVRTVPLTAEPVSGTGLILRVPHPEQNGSATVEADGYVLDIDPHTDLQIDTGEAPSISPFRRNVWIKYSGTLQVDGRVHVARAQLWLNEVTPPESRLLQKTDFDASQVTEDKRQGWLGRHVAGPNPERMPAFVDPDLQRRVDAIGARLVPAYQRDLPDSDPTKLHFRFQLIDETHYAFLGLPSGVILLSHQFAVTLPNDNQIAAALAIAMSDVLQKEAFRGRNTRHALTALDIGGAAAALVIAPVGLATVATTSGIGSSLEERLLKQRLRVALDLMYEAGFDPRAAPEAIWRMEQKKGKSLQDTPLGSQARYLYEVVYQLWSQPGNPHSGAPVKIPSSAGL